MGAVHIVAVTRLSGMTAPAATRRAARLRAAAAIDPSSQRSLESLGLGVGAIAFAVTALVALASFRFEPAPIAGPNSVGQFAAIASAVTAVLAFAAGRYVVKAPGDRLSVLEIVDVAALAFAHGVIALLGWTLLAVIFEGGFIGAEVFALPVVALSGAAAAVTGYVVFFSATHMDLSLLAVVLAVFLVMGILASTLSSADPQWWEMNLSALGATDDLSALAFNLTLIVAGVIVTTLARYATHALPTPHPHGGRNVRICLIVVGVFLACVGIFHVDEHFWIHNSVATGMAVAFAVAAVRLPVWVPGMPRAFVALGWLFIAIIAVLGVMFGVGYYTLTAVELVAGVLVFSWIILFIRNAAALREDTDRG